MISCRETVIVYAVVSCLDRHLSRSESQKLIQIVAAVDNNDNSDDDDDDDDVSVCVFSYLQPHPPP